MDWGTGPHGGAVMVAARNGSLRKSSRLCRRSFREVDADKNDGNVHISAKHIPIQAHRSRAFWPLCLHLIDASGKRKRAGEHRKGDSDKPKSHHDALALRDRGPDHESCSKQTRVESAASDPRTSGNRPPVEGRGYGGYVVRVDDLSAHSV